MQLLYSLFLWGYSILGFISCAPAMMSPMMFSNQNFGENKLNSILFLVVISFPLLCLFSTVIGSYVYRNYDPNLGLILMGLPTIEIIIFVIILIMSPNK